MGIIDDEYPELAGFNKSQRPFPGSATAGGPPCPTCGKTDSIVKETRRHGTVIRRRRQCVTHSCDRFTTYESIIDPEVIEFKMNKIDKRNLASVASLLKRISEKMKLD